MEITHISKSKYVDPFDRIMYKLENEARSAIQLSKLLDEVEILRESYNAELASLREKYQPQIDELITKIDKIV